MATPVPAFGGKLKAEGAAGHLAHSGPAYQRATAADPFPDSGRCPVAGPLTLGLSLCLRHQRSPVCQPGLVDSRAGPWSLEASPYLVRSTSTLNLFALMTKLAIQQVSEIARHWEPSIEVPLRQSWCCSNWLCSATCQSVFTNSEHDTREPNKRVFHEQPRPPTCPYSEMYSLRSSVGRSVSQVRILLASVSDVVVISSDNPGVS